MRELRRLVQEQVLYDDAFHRGQRRGDMLRIGIRLSDVFALDVQRLEFPVEGGFEHIGNAQTRLVAQRHAPGALEQCARTVSSDT